MQSNLGQLQGTGHVVGFEMPITGTEIGMPEVPFSDVKFESHGLAAAGIGAAVVGATLIANRVRRAGQDVNSEIYPAGSDMAKKNRRTILGGAARGFAGGVFATGLVAGALMDRAQPHTEKKVNEIGSVAVVIDTGYEALATDVDSDEGEISRYRASVNGLALDGNALSELQGIDVTFISAGANPTVVGRIEGDVEGEERTEAKAAILAGYAEQMADFGNRGTEASGGGDIDGAIRMAQVIDADRTIVVTGTMRGHEQFVAANDEATEENSDVITITLGQSGAEVEVSSGKTAPAPVEVEYNDLVVGEEDSYTATSMNELKDVVGEIIDEQIIDTETNDYDGYEKLWKYSLGGLGALGVYQFVRESGPRPVRSIKRWINNRRNK